MIARKCETCEHKNDKPCPHDWADTESANDWPCSMSGFHDWRSSRAALEAEVERLTKERDEDRDHTKILEDAVTYWHVKTLTAEDERDASFAQAAARDEEIATLRARVEDWAAQYRALSARVESELGGLRHSIAEVEDERDEAVSAMAEWRARAEVAEPERDRLRDGLEKALEFIGRCRWDEAGEIPPRDYDAIEGLRALLGDEAAHLLAPPPPTPEQRIAALEAELARERVRSDAAEARVRELEAERDRHEARERRLTALGFEPPGQDAHTCGDALGLRRLDEVDKDPPDPAKTPPV